MKQLVVYTDPAGHLCAIDAWHEPTQRGAYGKETLAEIKAKEPGARLMGWLDFTLQHDATYYTAPREITPAAYTEALECLPPVGWEKVNGVDSFKISERITGNATNIYAACRGRYWTWVGDIRTPPATIAARVLPLATAQA